MADFGHFSIYENYLKKRHLQLKKLRKNLAESLILAQDERWRRA